MKQGIKQNKTVFVMLVLINAFVGSMVGLERTILPILANKSFGIVSVAATLSFIVTFGFTKAIINLVAGNLADRFGRKKLLIIGWLIGLFVPILIIFASAWWVVIVANIFLGVNQGLTWSMTVNMKIDLAKPSEKGLAVSLNEFAGYVGMSATAALSGFLLSSYSPRPEPFVVGIGIVFIGLLLSIFLSFDEQGGRSNSKGTSFFSVFLTTSFNNSTMSTISLLGLMTNFKDGVVWGLFPLYFATSPLSIEETSIIIAVYPATWGVFQLFTGTVSDKWGRKWMILSGIALQFIGLMGILISSTYLVWLMFSSFLGIGTALVYPTLIASISDEAHTTWRATALGVYRFWRDSGYAFGALAAGFLTDLFSSGDALLVTAILLAVVFVIGLFRLQETHRHT